MKEQNTIDFNEKVIIKKLTRKHAIDLMSDSILVTSGVLNQTVKYKMMQTIKLLPQSTKLVAYHTKEKRAIGFLCLEKNTDWLYSIKYVFVDSKCRKSGIATGLLNYAMILAKEKGAGKVNLNVDLTSPHLINLYKKFGFTEIGNTLLAQESRSGLTVFRTIKSTILGLSYLTKHTPAKECQFHKLQTNSRKNQEILFNIYQSCVDQKWMEFFEINAKNVLNGSRHVWQPPFFREVIINESANSFALIFHQPLFSKATVELYSTSNTVFPSILDSLMKILSNKGINFIQITLFNLTNNTAVNWFKEKRMMTFQFAAMGRTL